MYRLKLMMPIEDMITLWVAMLWENKMSREELLVAQIRRLERRLEDLERACKWMKVAQMRNKDLFDRTHRLMPRKIEEGLRQPRHANSTCNINLDQFCNLGLRGR